MGRDSNKQVIYIVSQKVVSAIVGGKNREECCRVLVVGSGVAELYTVREGLPKGNKGRKLFEGSV